MSLFLYTFQLFMFHIMHRNRNPGLGGRKLVFQSQLCGSLAISLANHGPSLSLSFPILPMMEQFLRNSDSMSVVGC